MRRVVREVPYHEWAKEEFNEENLKNSLLSVYGPYTFDFGKGRRITIERRKLRASVENPSQDFIEESIKRYIQESEEGFFVRHTSSWHELELYGSRLDLNFLKDGKKLHAADSHAYYQTFKNEEELKKAIKKWTKIAKALGFKPLQPQTLQLLDGCEAIKLCTKFRELKEEEVIPYIIDLAKSVKELESKLEIRRYEPPASLQVDSSGILFLPDSVTYPNIEFALSLMGKLKERKERKEREKFEALENLANIAKQKIRLKKPHGFCVLVTTEKCAIKSIKKKKEKG